MRTKQSNNVTSVSSRKAGSTGEWREKPERWVRPANDLSTIGSPEMNRHTICRSNTFKRGQQGGQEEEMGKNT